jgi:hypothetical protein
MPISLHLKREWKDALREAPQDWLAIRKRRASRLRAHAKEAGLKQAKPVLPGNHKDFVKSFIFGALTAAPRIFARMPFR